MPVNPGFLYPRLPDATITQTPASGQSYDSNRIPLNKDDRDRQIQRLKTVLAGLPLNKPGLISLGIYQSLNKRLLQLTGGASYTNNGIPPAPDPAATFLNQIVSDKIGLEDLTIPLP